MLLESVDQIYNAFLHLGNTFLSSEKKASMTKLNIFSLPVNKKYFGS
jgi:hypothetical protein